MKRFYEVVEIKQIFNYTSLNIIFANLQRPSRSTD